MSLCSSTLVLNTLPSWLLLRDRGWVEEDSFYFKRGNLGVQVGAYLTLTPLPPLRKLYNVEVLNGAFWDCLSS